MGSWGSTSDCSWSLCYICLSLEIALYMLFEPKVRKKVAPSCGQSHRLGRGLDGPHGRRWTAGLLGRLRTSGSRAPGWG